MGGGSDGDEFIGGGCAVMEVRHASHAAAFAEAFVKLTRRFPLELTTNDRPVCVRAGVDALAAVKLAGGVSEQDVDLTPEQGYAIGLAVLALRSEAVEISGKSYAHAYSVACRQSGFEALSARIRRRAMYLPILAEDCALHEVAAEQSRGRSTFPLVKTTGRLKDLRLSNLMAIDWLPFGGPP